MKTPRSMITLPMVVAFMVTLAFHGSFAADTNATVGTIDFQFVNAPAFAAINWLARLTGKPFIVPLNATAHITYKTERKVTPDEAIRALTTQLASNNLYVVNVGDLYYRLVTASDTNKVVDNQRVEMALQDDGVLIEGRFVRWEDLPKALGILVMPDEEIWIYDPKVMTGPESDSAQLGKLLNVLGQAKVGKIYRAYLPARHK